MQIHEIMSQKHSELLRKRNQRMPRIILIAAGSGVTPMFLGKRLNRSFFPAVLCLSGHILTFHMEGEVTVLSVHTSPSLF